jgi:hypothetical protein
VLQAGRAPHQRRHQVGHGWLLSTGGTPDTTTAPPTALSSFDSSARSPPTSKARQAPRPRWSFPEEQEQGSRCWTRNGASRANQTYCQNALQAAHKASLRTGAAGAGARSGWPGEAAGWPARACAKPLPAPHSRAAKRGPFRWQSKADSVAKAPGFKSKGGGTSAVACGAREQTRSDFTAERCLQLTATHCTIFSAPFQSLGLVFLSSKRYVVEDVHVSFGSAAVSSSCSAGSMR